MKAKITGKWPILMACAVVCLAISCKKLDDALDNQNADSGIIRIVQNGRDIGEAQIDETVTIYAKIGEPAAPVTFYVSGVEAAIISRGPGNSTVYPASGGQVQVPMDTFNIIIPKGARIGPGNIHFTINQAAKPSMAFNVKRPDILFSGKIWVEPMLFSWSDSTVRSDGSYDYFFPRELKDGPSKKAVVHTAAKLTYDRDNNVFYFLDADRSDNRSRIRRMQDGVVTTIAGGGNDHFATTGNNLALNIGDMKPGPDGMLYFTNMVETDPDPVSGLSSYYSLIQRIDPMSGKVEILAGNNGRSIDAYPSNWRLNYTGIEDGPRESAMIEAPQALTFDKKGDLYFLEGGELIRRLNKDGSIETVLGKIDRHVQEIEDFDGVTYKVVYYSPIYEHSDGFGDDVRLYGATNMVQAGNGKFYVLGNGAGWATNIVEINMDTKEAATIVGMPQGQYSDFETGTFKEVGLSTITTFDVDYDGNILYGFTSIFKMDLQQEMIYRMTGFKGFTPPYKFDREFMQNTQPGDNCLLGRVNRIVFDQFGNLYVGYDYTAAGADVRIVKLIIQK
ncbi:MAG: hypothetical protein P0Y53_12775 [Candidatus Pseudobacter hemicellulosilyticus]|uniref:Uncharacterized protein n=1 Tax=Candidatus Pseudobacter hemicellulosilyticus TaxID=3121375 RepID=A0AAJ6BIJ2_9BACT|nr:MAG: hypothetical protein P0Y53_12775 [Pseudobacter sp.]